MNTRKISIAFQTNKNPAEYIALAKLVNHFDFDIVSVYCDAPFHPSYGPLLLMAPYLDHAMVGPAAVSPFRMHPIDIAANTALLASVVGERVYVGITRGAWLEDYGIQEPAKPILGIREAVMVIHRLLSGGTAGFDGRVFKIADHVRAPYPVPKAKIPIMIGTWGPKMATLAGKIADEVKVGGSTNPAVARKILGYINRGCSEAGRAMNTVGLAMGAVTVVDDDRKTARLIAKNEIALYLPVVAKLDPTENLEPELVARIKTYVEQGDVQSAAGLIEDDLLEKFAFAGNENDIVRQAEALFQKGVSRVEFGTPHGITPETGIRILGERVIPRLRGYS
ncbi:MAG: LLM class flavin-dependent oxidoreductase [Anaerolineales bacterium]|nr:LLM class flavin-dependent oxidoreductase [Anaerolineales bacterium]